MMLNFKIVDPVGVNSQSENAPEEFRLHQNYPNPFNPSTKITYDIPRSGNVTLKIYNASGNEISTLVNEYKPAGYYVLEFNGRDLPSGVYYAKLKAETFL
ncbi:MAG: T9SS type A sorting domain-containing protein [Ignavibacteria bacterium]|nr:T9SS type A sorting domain-containing protein [Ignavibacteria bacterium]